MMVSNSEFECCCIDQSACLYLEELPAEEHWVGDALRLAVDELLEQLLVEVVSMSVNQCAVVLRGPVLLKAHKIFKNKEQKQVFNLSKKNNSCTLTS